MAENPLSIFQVAGRAMSAQLVRMNTTASNLANAGGVATTADAAYRTMKPVFRTQFDQASGSYINDVTVGTYDVVISEQPMQVTFENSQFQQVMEMRNAGVRVPDATVIRYSNLADKPEILEAMESSQAPVDPTLQAKAELLAAQTRKADADARQSTNKATAVNVEAQYSAAQTAQVIRSVPGVAGTADALLRSAGYIDHDAAPIVPEASGMPADAAGAELPDVPSNTDPVHPANPAVGMMAGIKTPGPDGLQL